MTRGGAALHPEHLSWGIWIVGVQRIVTEVDVFEVLPVSSARFSGSVLLQRSATDCACGVFRIW